MTADEAKMFDNCNLKFNIAPLQQQTTCKWLRSALPYVMLNIIVLFLLVYC